MKEQSAQDKIEIARLALLTKDRGKWLFFGHLVLNLDPVPNEHLEAPAATNGKQMFYKPSVIDQLDIPEICGLTAHETLHTAFGHTIGHKYNRTGNRDPMRWNIATDVIVNEIVRRNGLPLPGGELRGIFAEDIPFDPPLDKDVLEYTAEQLYQRVPITKQPQQGQQGQQGKGQGQQSNTGGMPDPRGKCGLLDPNAGKGGDAGNGNNPAKMTEIEKQIWLARVKAAEQQSRQAGNQPAGIEQLIEELFKPQVDWKRELHEFIQIINEDETFLPPSRRMYAIQEMFPKQVVFPALADGEILADLIIAVDSSGSINDEELKEFVSEVHAVATVGTNIWLVYCDAAVQGWHELDLHPKMPAAKGRGGTSFRPVFDEIKKRGMFCQGVVYFTDGYPNDGWPENPGYPVVWVINNDHGMEMAEQEAAYGRRIRYPKHNERPDYDG